MIRPKVIWRMPNRNQTVLWPDDWPLPRKNDLINIDGSVNMRVAHVIWYPLGGPDSTEPFIYIVLNYA